MPIWKASPRRAFAVTRNPYKYSLITVSFSFTTAWIRMRLETIVENLAVVGVG